MRELLPGLFHWSVVHPVIHKPVGSYYVEPAGLVIDPLLPEVGVALFDGHQPPRQVVLTNRHHYRDSAALAEAFGCPVRCCRAGLHEFAHDERRVEGFDFGAEIAPGVTALEVGSICPDDTALHLAIGEGVLAFADGLTRPDGGPLRFVADSLMGDDPEGTGSQRGLRPPALRPRRALGGRGPPGPGRLPGPGLELGLTAGGARARALSTTAPERSRLPRRGRRLTPGLTGGPIAW